MTTHRSPTESPMKCQFQSPEKDSFAGTISASVQPSTTFVPTQQELSAVIPATKPLPLHLCLEDFHEGIKPIAWIPETVGRALLRSEISGWSNENPKDGQILEYWCESTNNQTVMKPLALHEGGWVIPAERMAECSDCVTEHMKRFVKLCEEALSLSQPTDCRFLLRYNVRGVTEPLFLRHKAVDQHVRIIADRSSAVHATRPERQKPLPDGTVVAFFLPYALRPCHRCGCHFGCL